MKKSKQIRVLVTGVGAEVGQGIIKALRLSKYNCNIIGCDMNPDSAGFFMCDDYYVVPKATSLDYLDRIINICKNRNIQLIFPAVDLELPILSKNRLLFKNIGTALIVQPEDILNTFLSKYSTYKFLKNNNIPVPTTLLIDNKNDIKKVITKFNFPLILKPNLGQGSKNVYVVCDKKELSIYLQLVKNRCVIQQYLPEEDEEYTCGIFNCNYLKEPYVIAFKRKLIDGVSGVAEVSFDEDVISVCKRIAKCCNLEGVINIQLRKFKNKPFIFEINPRFSSTTGIRAKCGFNDVEMAIDYFLFNKIPPKPNIQKKKILRYKDEIYIDI